MTPWTDPGVKLGRPRRRPAFEIPLTTRYLEAASWEKERAEPWRPAARAWHTGAWELLLDGHKACEARWISSGDLLHDAVPEYP